MPCIFGNKEDKITIGLRKVAIQKRPSKKTGGKTLLYYLPIHKDEAQRLGLNEGSLLKAELAVLVDHQPEEVGPGSLLIRSRG
ncbi:MAG: hypothetical protein ACREBS_08910 [Nitrososphaerales archaeon]